MSLRDSTTMYGTAHAPWSENDLRAFWEEQCLILLGRPPEPRAEVLTAYVNLGRWVADCPICAGGIAASPRIPVGCCLDCGSIFSINTPSGRLLKEAEDVLNVRPKPAQQNWYPSAGIFNGHPVNKAESVEQLKQETEAILASPIPGEPLAVVTLEPATPDPAKKDKK